MIQPISLCAVVFTFNEEKNIEACLQSITGWCQQIFVVDSGSTDQTLAVCRKYTDLIYPHAYVDHASHWNWTLKSLPFACEWLLRLDADNTVSDRLKNQIAEALENTAAEVDGYYVVHRHFFRNRPVRGLKTHWLCLIRHQHTRIDSSELVDFRFVTKGRTRSLPGEIIESNQKELEIDFWLDKHQKFSSRMAAEEVLRRAGLVDWSIRPSLLGNPDERVLWFKNRWYHLPLYLRPFLYFGYRYVFRLGFLDGMNGFLYHFLQAFSFRLIVDIKISEVHRDLKSGALSLEQLKATFLHEF